MTKKKKENGIERDHRKANRKAARRKVGIRKCDVRKEKKYEGEGLRGR